MSTEQVQKSRVGRKPVAIPAGVEVKLEHNFVSVKGPKGQLTTEIHPFIKITQKDNAIHVNTDADVGKKITGKNVKLYRSISGTTRANIANIINGVSKGFERKLLLVGVGYRAQAKGKVLALSLGYSHPTDFNVPEGVTVETPTQTEIIIKGPNKALVGLVAAKIRKIRGPEPYKGKGVRYSDETIEIKETKKK